jgi:two-component system chemotaxis response regulator CheB
VSGPLVAIGASLGGLQAVSEILRLLPAGVTCPIAIVQHRDPRSGPDLLFILQHASRLPVVEAEDKMPVAPGNVYLAPPDYHLLVDGDSFALSVDAPVYAARPSIDVFFESVADARGPRAIGVLLTGSNRDGARGLARIKAAGGKAFVQDPETAHAPEMPQAGLESTRVDGRLGLAGLAERLALACGECS